MKHFASLFFLWVFLTPLVHAQDHIYPVVYHEDLMLTMGHPDFQDQLTLRVAVDADYDYYLVDLTKFDDDFQRAFFLDLVYQEPTIISIDSDLDKEHLWVKSSSVHPEEETTCLIDELKEEAAVAAGKFTGEEREAWMQKHKKLLKK